MSQFYTLNTCTLQMSRALAKESLTLNQMTKVLTCQNSKHLQTTN